MIFVMLIKILYFKTEPVTFFVVIYIIYMAKTYTNIKKRLEIRAFLRIYF
jgi:hypothetical protein